MADQQFLKHTEFQGQKVSAKEFGIQLEKALERRIHRARRCFGTRWLLLLAIPVALRALPTGFSGLAGLNCLSGLVCLRWRIKRAGIAAM